MSRPQQQQSARAPSPQAPAACYSTDPFIKQGCREACTYATCPPSLSYWSYTPSLLANALLLGFFGVSLLAFLAINVARKRAFMSFSLIMVAGNVLEAIGYGGRILARERPFSPEPFLMQIIGLTLAPAFYAAAIYFCLARIINLIGAQHSRIPPSRIPRIFIVCDIVALGLQAAGGGLAASSKLSGGSPTLGADILIGGLAFQVFTMLLFVVLVLDFALRSVLHRKAVSTTADCGESIEGVGATETKFDSLEDLRSTQDQEIKTSKRFRGFLAAWSVATLCIFARCVYRVAELSEGYSGHLVKTQVYFIVLEGAVVAAAVASLNLFHPAFCLHRMPPKSLA